MEASSADNEMQGRNRTPDPAPNSPAFSSGERITVQVPATSANLGSGFDTLGVALALYNRFSFMVLPEGVASRTEATGEGAAELNQPGESLVLIAARAVATAAERSLPPLLIHIDSTIPVQRGLGSSATAVVAGVVAANRLLGEPFTPDLLLQIAVRVEGHADNVTPAFFGGFQTAVCDGNAVLYCPMPIPEGVYDALRLVVCVPELRLSTGVARAALPTAVSHRDAVFNLGRAALLVTALCAGKLSCLKTALHDRLHQPFRAHLIPGFTDALTAAENAGAFGACLSGSGSTLLAFVPAGKEPVVGAAMVSALCAAGVPARWMGMGVDAHGATFIP